MKLVYKVALRGRVGRATSCKGTWHYSAYWWHYSAYWWHSTSR